MTAIVDLEKIFYSLQRIDERISAIEENITIIGYKCDKMDKHVDFVNTVYDRVKTPFHYIMNLVTLRFPASALRADNNLLIL